MSAGRTHSDAPSVRRSDSSGPESTGPESIDSGLGDGGLKGAMKGADRAGARFALVLGEQELENGVVAVKDLAAHEQNDVAIDALVEHLRNQLN